MERPDGNNVSLERESLLLAETQMRYNMGVELLQDQFHIISQRHQFRRHHLMNLFGMLEVSGSALAAERWRAEVVTSQHGERRNHPHSAGRPLPAAAGGVSRRPLAAISRCAARAGCRARRGGVRVTRVVADPAPPRRALRAGTSGCRRHRATSRIRRSNPVRR